MGSGQWGQSDLRTPKLVTVLSMYACYLLALSMLPSSVSGFPLSRPMSVPYLSTVLSCGVRYYTVLSVTVVVYLTRYWLGDQSNITSTFLNQQTPCGAGDGGGGRHVLSLALSARLSPHSKCDRLELCQHFRLSLDTQTEGKGE